MKALLQHVICTEDSQVLQFLYAQGWPSFYSYKDCFWDMACLESRLRLGHEPANQAIPVKMFHHYNIEIAKKLVQGEYKAQLIRFFARTFMTRTFTKEEIRHICKHTRKSHKAHVLSNIQLLNSAYLHYHQDIKEEEKLETLPF